MYFKFPCTNCGKNLKVREENVGRKARCPYCHTSVVVPEPPQQPESSGLDLASLDLSAAESPTTGPSPLDPLPQEAPGINIGAPQVKSTAITPSVSRGKKTTKVETPAAESPARRASDSGASGTNVSMLWTALVGLGLTLLFYAAVYPLPDDERFKKAPDDAKTKTAEPEQATTDVTETTVAPVSENPAPAAPKKKFVVYFRELFYERGWVTIAEAFLMWWSVAILIFKSRKLMRQKESMLFDVLPEELSRDITVAELPKYTKHVRDLPVDPSASFLIQRVLRGLEHFSVRRSASEVSTMLGSQSQIDAVEVSSSYAILNVFIWAIPILGFIGTVQGLGEAVGNLSGSLEGAGDVEGIKTALGEITSGLGVAFDTTLVALIMSLLLKLPASSMQKSEEDLLNWVDEYCNENLLKRLNDGDHAAPAADPSSRTIQKAIDAAMAEHHAELRTWTKKLQSIGSTLTEDVVKGWSSIHDELQQKHEQRLAQINQSVGSLAEVVPQIAAVGQQLAALQQTQAHQIGEVATTVGQQAEAIERRAEEHQARVEQNLNRMVEQLQQTTADLAEKVAAHSQQALSELAERNGTVQTEVAESMRGAAQSMQTYFGGLEQGLSALNGVLVELGQKQVVIQTQPAPRKSWSLFRRGNGKR